MAYASVWNWKPVALALVILVLFLTTVVGASEYYTSRSEFCGGTCHAMRAQHNTWKQSEHRDIPCIDCHTKSQGELLEDWKDTVTEELKYAKELEAEALAAIEAVKSEALLGELDDAKTKLEEARKNMHLVEFGNGVHNKKYSMQLLDAAITSFEELSELLGERADGDTTGE